MPVPTNTSTLQVFLGFANYYSDFIPNILGRVRKKTFMRNYVLGPNMNKEIEEKVTSCRDCVIATKAPPGKFTHWIDLGQGCI